MKVSDLVFSEWLDQAVKGAVIALMAYWAVYALVVPVTVWDAQTHDVARLLIAHNGGLFRNHGWNNPVQAFFPWGFNAVEYPFIFLRFGYALPSFACFTGLLVIVYRLVKEKYGSACAWWCCLSMLALPTLIFQATSTKSDLAVVFGVFCWFYALRFFLLTRQRDRKAVYLGLMALALSFAAGAKSSGVPLAATLSAYTLWRIGPDKLAIIQFALLLTAGLFLFGSVETYINNILAYKSVLGPQDMVRKHMNRDGLCGALANAIRYYFCIMNIGVDVASRSSHFSGWMTDECRRLLGLLDLKNVGYYNLFEDETFRIEKSGGEATSDYGPVGALALIYASWAWLIHPTKEVSWKLACAGLFSLAIVCYTIGWQPWCNRFLMLPMILFTLTLTLAVVRSDGTRFHQYAATPFLGILLFSAIAFPLCSYNKAPRDLIRSIVHRDEMVAKERPEMLEIMKDIEALPGRVGPAVLLLHAGRDSWILPIMQIPLKEPNLCVISAPDLNLEAIKSATEIAHGRPLYILALNQWMEPDAENGLILIRKYESPNSALLEVRKPMAK